MVTTTTTTMTYQVRLHGVKFWMEQDGTDYFDVERIAIKRGKVLVSSHRPNTPVEVADTLRHIASAIANDAKVLGYAGVVVEPVFEYELMPSRMTVKMDLGNEFSIMYAGAYAAHEEAIAALRSAQSQEK